MNAALVWNNLLAYSLQIGMLVARGGLRARAGAPAAPRARGWSTGRCCWPPACCCRWCSRGSQEVIAGNVSVATVVASIVAGARAGALPSFAGQPAALPAGRRWRGAAWRGWRVGTLAVCAATAAPRCAACERAHARAEVLALR